MAQVLRRKQASQPALDSVNDEICAVARAVAADHALAFRASATAALSRQCLAEVRAMYVSPDGHIRRKQ